MRPAGMPTYRDEVNIVHVKQLHVNSFAFRSGSKMFGTEWATCWEDIAAHLAYDMFLLYCQLRFFPSRFLEWYFCSDCARS